MEDKARWEEKVQKEANERALKAEKQWQMTCALSMKQFGGALSSKFKTEIKDIVAALALVEDGNKHTVHTYTRSALPFSLLPSHLTIMTLAVSRHILFLCQLVQ